MRLGVILLLVLNCCAFGVAVVPSVVHVDGVNGSDLNSGLTRHLAVASIQQGIDLTADGGTVLVWPGRYTGPISFDGKAITVRSAADAAVIDGQDDFPVLFYNGEGPDSVLKNFVIENSISGVTVFDGSPTLEQLTVVKNFFGIFVSQGSDALIHNSIFRGNELVDVDGAEVDYSCVQDEVPGQGNMNESPRFADFEGGDYHLRSEAGRFEPYAPGSYEWVEVRTYTELNDGRHKPYTPMLSDDGLTIYFSRYIPELGDICIVEAYRDTPNGEFTSERVLSELFEYNRFISGPWISQDGRRLYYHARMHDGISRVHMAEFNEQTGLWERVKIFDEINDGSHGNALPSLSDDELIITWHSRVSDDDIDSFIATRASRNDPFTDVRPLDEINTDRSNNRPQLLDNGLTLYYGLRTFVDGLKTKFYMRAVRDSVYEPFGRIERLPLPVPDDTEVYFHDHQFVTRDQKQVLLQSESGIRQFNLKVGQWVLDEVTSPCIDGGDPTVNPMVEPMPNGALANIGAYGVTPYASRSVNPWPNPYDVDYSGKVDFADYVKFAENWLWKMPWAQ